jgi:hypothetical protein
MQLDVAAQTLDRRDLATFTLSSQHQTREHSSPVDQHRARPAGALVAALLGAAEPQPVAKRIQQCLVTRNSKAAPFTDVVNASSGWVATAITAS